MCWTKESGRRDARVIAERVAVVGVGLIGGSVGLALKERRLAREVVGTARRQSTLDAALARGAVDRGTLDLVEAVEGADLVYLSTPVESIPRLLAEMQSSLQPDALVTDAGSTKVQIVAEAERILSSGSPHFVGGHPMAGSEKMGVAFARADLFEGATYVLTPTKRTNAEVLERMRVLAESLGSRVLIMSPEEHDEVVAFTSHLPHFVSWALAQAAATALDINRQAPLLAATGYRDATRLADSSTEIWSQIAVANRGPLLAALDEMAARLGEIRNRVASRTEAEIAEWLTEAAKGRERMIGRQVKD